MDLFFYGTLCDRGLLSIVLGDGHGDVVIHDAVLIDHSVYWVKDASYPIIVTETGAEARGLLVQGLTENHVARLDFYEGGFGYELRDFQVSADIGAANCQMYWPDDPKLVCGDPWDLTLWQDRFGETIRLAATETMSYFGMITTHELAVLYPMIVRRAASRLRAQRQPAPAAVRIDRTSEDVQKESVERGHLGFYALDVMALRHKKFDGRQSDLLRREVFLSADAAIVLPYDPVTDQVLMVEQFRMGPTGRGDPRPWCLEPVAGLVDAGEEPETTAHREAMEEAGLTFSALETVANGYSSPGASSGYFFLYIGLCDLSDHHSDASGCEDEGEDIRSHVLGFEHAMQLVDSGEINILPTILCLNWLARHRSRLRGAA